MTSQKLLFARAYEQEAEMRIPPEARPKFHFSSRTGWANDPNGFSWYKGEYHLFYQYHPYKSIWSSMHWGHAVSTDLLHWKYLPTALAPDQDYDSFGCFSGSAAELSDGRQLILYTGVRKDGGDDALDIQTQCAAVGDGLNYEKYPGNPILDEKSLPDGMDKNNFRDPKIWKEPDGSFRCVVGARRENLLGSLLLFKSRDGFRWEFESILLENDGRFGYMWECPDFFTLDSRQVAMVSPQDMLPEGFEYHNGNGTVCFIGHWNEDKTRFIPEHNQAIDYGIDFYAPQTILTPDGRRIMIGWMQNWDTCPAANTEKRPWFGQMSIPRELAVKNNRLYQMPVRELEAYRSGMVEYRDVNVSGELTLPGVEGRTAELLITLRPRDPQTLYRKFAVRFAQDGQYRTSVSFRPFESVVKLDRKRSGSRRALIHQRRCLVPRDSGVLKMRLILDKFSVELFINDGEQVMTATFYTDLTARGISFFADGEAVMDLVKYDLFEET